MAKMVLYNMDVLKALEKIPSESIDCIITSPPYFSLRNYGEDTNAIWDECYLDGEKKVIACSAVMDKGEHEWNESNFCNKCLAWKGQLGLEPTMELYISHLMEITAELKRVLKPTGTLWWNMNDSYASGGGKAVENAFNRASGKETGQPDNPAKATLRATLGKSQLLIPEQFAIKMVYEGGWLRRNNIIWHKEASMPTSSTDRFANAFEPTYFFVKDKKYYFNLDAVRIKRRYPSIRMKQLCTEIYLKAKKMRNQSKLLSYNGKVKLENEEVANNPELQKTKSNASSLQAFLVAIRTITKEVMEEHPELTEADRKYLNAFKQAGGGNPEGTTPTDIWAINTESMGENHTAAFPQELPRRCMKAGAAMEVCVQCGKPKLPFMNEESISAKFKPTCECNAGFKAGVVLDPFGGSGTTMKVAMEMGYDCITIEISKKYVGIIERRCKLIEKKQLNQVDYDLISG